MIRKWKWSLLTESTHRKELRSLRNHVHGRLLQLEPRSGLSFMQSLAEDGTVGVVGGVKKGLCYCVWKSCDRAVARSVETLTARMDLALIQNLPVRERAENTLFSEACCSSYSHRYRSYSYLLLLLVLSSPCIWVEPGGRSFFLERSTLAPPIPGF